MKERLLEALKEHKQDFALAADYNLAVRIAKEAGPAAQPDIIRCKDCKWHSAKYHCLNTDTWGFGDNDFCSYVERGTRCK